MTIITYLDSYSWNNEEYFSFSEDNGLFKRKRENEKAEFIGRFPDESINIKGLHKKVLGYDDNIWFFPFFGTGISKYNITDNHFEFCELNNGNVLGVADAFMINNSILAVPVNTSMPIYEIDKSKNSIKNRIFLPYEEISENGNAIDICGVDFFENQLFIAARDTRQVIVLDILKQIINILCISECIAIRNISIINKEIWITEADKIGVIKIDLITHKSSRISIENIANDNGMLLRIVDWNGKIIALPGTNSRLYEYDRENNYFFDMNLTLQKNCIGNIGGYQLGESMKLYSYDSYCEEAKMREGHIIVQQDCMIKWKAVRSDYDKKILNNEMIKDHILHEKNDTIHSLRTFISFI